MLPIAITAGVADVAIIGARLAGLIDLPPYIFVLMIAAAAAAYLSRQSSTLIRGIIGFLLVWHLASVGILILKEAGALPAGLAPYLPTRASVLLSAIFAIVVYGLSFVGTIRQIAKLADPFFETRDIGELRLPFGVTFRVQERYIAHALLFVLLAINIAQVLATVLLNQWNNRFYTALQEKAEATFWVELRYFTVVAFLWVILAVYELYLTQYTQMRWRRWMTGRLTGHWLDQGAHYRMRLAGGQADNPDQRIAEDVRMFTSNTLDLVIRFFSAILSLYAFVLILWGLSANFKYQVWGINLETIPGYLVWAALFVAVFGTICAHFIGRSLIGINFLRQRYEADFRYSLVRVRENDEQIALLKGEGGRAPGAGRALHKGRRQLVRLHEIYQAAHLVHDLRQPGVRDLPLRAAGAGLFLGRRAAGIAHPDCRRLRPGRGRAAHLHQPLFDARRLQVGHRPPHRLRALGR